MALPGSDGCERLANANTGQLLAVFGAIAALPSLATPIAIAVYGARGNGVPLELSVTSTVLWSGHTALALASIVIPVANGPYRPAWELSIPYLAVSGAVLGLSIWAITKPLVIERRIELVFRADPTGVGAIVGGAF